MNEFMNLSLCTKCGGRCCKFRPGAFSPSDFQDWRTELLELVSSKYIKIDHDVYGVLFPRPTIVGHTEFGLCIFLREEGCALSFSKRPSECRALEPKENLSCVSHGRDTLLEWEPYGVELRALRDLEWEVL